MEKMMDKIEALVARYEKLAACEPAIRDGYRLLEETFSRGGKLLLCGNGGSASDAEHIVGELMKSFEKERGLGEKRDQLYAALPEADAKYLSDRLQGALPAISLHGETALVSAFANDVSADLIYAQQVLGLGKPGDCLVALTTSGNSQNVLRAAQVAKALGLRVLGLTGGSGGKLKALCDVCICVPETETYRVQELHLPVYHALCSMLEEHFF